MKFIKLILVVMVFCFFTGNAQQDPNHLFYRYSMNLINPAYAGVGLNEEGGIQLDRTTLGLNIRSQWAGVEGAPETQSIFFGTGVSEKIGLGVSVINDRTFIETQTSVTIDVSYKVQVEEQSNLYLGIKAGGNSYGANLAGLTTFGIAADASLNNISGRFNPNIGAGLLLKGRQYFLAFSIPNLLTTERLEGNDQEAVLGESRNHLNLAAGYDFKLSRVVTFKPSALARYVDGAPFSLDLTAGFSFNEKFDTGLNYRLDEGIGVLFLFRGTDWVDFGYAYETASQNPIADNSMGSHEILVKFKM